ncbi:Uncharacterized conserved protein [Aureimonas phyllosphaerae]|nr:Uncharacterized conserved protein [Aureimonas phyllosphaerae]
MACHCTGCQKMTASAFSLSALFPAASFAVSAGETAIGGLHGGSKHHFCAHCLTWTFTRPEGMDDFVNVRSPMLGASLLLDPFMETCTAEKLPWVRMPATFSFEKFPQPDAFPSILASYAAQNSTIEGRGVLPA